MVGMEYTWQAEQEEPLNILDQRPDNLAHTHHVPLLKAALAALENYNPFAWHKSSHLMLDVDGIAQRVLAKPWREADLLTPAPQGSARSSTLHMAPEARDETRHLLQRIQGRLAQHLEALAGLGHLSVQDLARQRMGALQKVPPFGTLAQAIPEELRRPFSARRKRLTFTKPADGTTARQPPPGSGAIPSTGRSPLLAWHKLTVTIQEPDDVMEQLAEAVRLKLEQVLDSSDYEDLHERINEQAASPTSELARLVRIIATETVGQLKKEACLCYLTFLEEQMDERNRMRPALRELLRRLRLLQAYLRREDKADAAYEVAYQGQTMNLRSVFAQATAFSDLPVFPLVDGSLGEITNQGTHTYIFGMKLKLNGKVAPYNSPSSFAYHLALLRKEYPASPEHLVRLAVLYHLMLSHFGDSTYDPIAALEQDILPLLQRDTASPDGLAAVERLFITIADRCEESRGAVSALAAALRSVVRQTTQATSQHWDVALSIREGILESTPAALLDEGRLLRQVFASDRKDYLAYLEVGEPHVTSHTLLTLRAQITFEALHCFEAEGQVETCEIGYDASGWTILPVFLSVPTQPLGSADLTATPNSASHLGLMLQCAAQITRNGTLMPARTSSPTHWFIYRYVVTLLAYLGIRLLASFGPDPTRLFISLARMHRVSEQERADGDSESFMADLSKVLAQMLSVDYLASAQGLFQPQPPASDVPGQKKQRPPIPDYKIHNAATSLYAPLPKVFTLQQALPDVLPRLALVVVSSRESDSLSQSSPGAQERLATVYGEVVGIEHLDERRVRVQRRATFSDTYPAQDLYTNPAIILDQMHHLYQAGYRHIFYVAQTPYSSTLHITRKGQDRALAGQDDDGLFFLSRQIITRCLQDNPGLHIYPVFRDQYHAMKLARDLGADTLYIQDLAELTQVVDDRSQAQQMVVFLNLFSGHTNVASRDGADKYNGVVSYATLLNMYGGVLKERDLRAALIHDEGGKNPLKNLLVLYLTLFHLSRYEKQERGPIAIKLNPYEAIIGDKSVGAAAAQPHANRFLRFNFLSFLTMVRSDILAAPEK
jgi:hypothetical protein